MVLRVIDQNQKSPCIKLIPELNVFSLLSDGKLNYESDRLKQEYLRFKIPEFPCLLDADGAPWAEGNTYLLNSVFQRVELSLQTAKSIASDLLRFLRFLSAEAIDFKKLPTRRPAYPIHRFQHELNMQVKSGELAISTANRCVGRIQSFYDWMVSEEIVSEKFISSPFDRPKYRGRYFRENSGKSVAEVTALRSLDIEEQKVLVNFLKNKANVEMRLIFTIAILTGMRLQSVLTLKRHIFEKYISGDAGFFSITIGEGTEIDSKFGRRNVIYFPDKLMGQLETYANSKRALSRRKTHNPTHFSNYLFLNTRGKPYYVTKSDRIKIGNNCFNSGEYLSRYIQKIIKPETGLKFKFHCLRATFAMNLVDRQLALVEKGAINLNQARNTVRERLGHTSSEVTDQYLNIRKHMTRDKQLQDRFESDLLNLG